MKRLFLSLISLFLFLSLVSCTASYGHCELILALDNEYQEVKSSGFDKCYTNGIYAVGIVRISFEAGFNQGIAETMSASEFAEFWKTKTERDATVETDAVTPYYTYEADGYFYLSGFYRSPLAYFVVLLSAPTGVSLEAREDFIKILDGAKFDLTRNL